MAAKKNGELPDWSAPAVKGVALTPADTDLAVVPCRSLWVGGAGNVSVILADDSSAVTIVGVAAGTLLPLACKQVRSTSTTATSIVALY